MKNLIKPITLLTLSLACVSCKSDQEERAEKLTNDYVQFVDSVSNVSADDAAAKWDNIEKLNDKKTEVLNSEVDKLENKSSVEEKINLAEAKYEEFKKTIIEKKLALDNQNVNLIKKKELFGTDYISDDLKFEWVNKDNILSVYDNFVTAVSKNKDSYSREEWDEVKMFYEALDTRKNTVEKEGLSSSDNRKIAMLKIKFAPMFTLNRMGAKSEENANAKK